MLACCEQLTPQFLNDAGLREWHRCNQLPANDRDAERDKLQIHLQPLQGVSLTEIHHCRGFFGSLTVGRGKTLISWLIGLVFPDLSPIVLLLPGGLKGKKGKKVDKLGKTELEFKKISRYWKSPQHPIKLVGYEYIARDENSLYLCGCPKCGCDVCCVELPPETRAQYTRDGCPKCKRQSWQPGIRPKVIIADECDMLKDADSGRSRRILRYMENHPETVFIAFTGTMQRKSMDDYAHLMIAALRERAPVPIPWHVRDMWKSALDHDPKDGVRRRPGALLYLSDLPDNDNRPADIEYGEYERACDCFYLRLSQTPGVIMDTEQSCTTPIYIRILKPPDDPVIEAAFEHFRTHEKTPEGYDVSGNFPKAAHGQELASGFYNLWDPKPPEEWVEARKAYYKLIKEVIAQSERNGNPIDTPEQAEKFLRNHPTVLAWKRIKPIYDPKKHAKSKWISSSVLMFAAEWIRLNTPALIWVKDIPVGNALEALTRVPYYGSGGRDKRGNLLDNADPKTSCIVSVDANMRGRNLQAWNRCLVFAPMQPETEWEQGALGRMHRKGQLEAVYCDIIVSSADSLYCLEKAVEVAAGVRLRQKFAQKILLATWDWSPFPAGELANMPYTDPRRPRWNRAKPANAA